MSNPNGRASRIAVLVVAYENEAFISRLLDRIPEVIAGTKPSILVSDDASTDRTYALAEGWAIENGRRAIQVVRRTTNGGYGSNQKSGFAWAARECADVVVLLHGDEQYPPEMIEDLVQPIVRNEADAVFGSRMLIPGSARKGGMPLVRFVGNKTLSRLLNVSSGAHLSEWFSGFRAYRLSVLSAISLDDLSDGFDFDTAIFLRLLNGEYRIREVPIPTHYGAELSRVPLLKTGLATMSHAGRAALHRLRRGRAASHHRTRA